MLSRSAFVAGPCLLSSGRTQIEAGSRTVLGVVGESTTPLDMTRLAEGYLGPVDLVRRVTGTLRPL